MFGYVKVYQPELKMGEFEYYRGIYCALCRRLGKRYGLVAQWSLSYDFTFLALFRLAQAERCVGFKKARCPYNPFKKRTCCCDTEQLDAVADAAVLLTYYKVQDTLADAGFFKKLGALLLYLPTAYDRRRCRKRHPDWDDYIGDCMRKQRELEQRGCTSLDQAAEPTALILQFLFSLQTTDEAECAALSRFGYCLGRWIYQLDAADDLTEDRKCGDYNPLLLAYGQMTDDEIRKQCHFSLNASLAECKAAYDRLTVHRFDGIIQNVLEWGMPTVQRQVINQEYPRSHNRKERSNEQSV